MFVDVFTTSRSDNIISIDIEEFVPTGKVLNGRYQIASKEDSTLKYYLALNTYEEIFNQDPSSDSKELKSTQPETDKSTTPQPIYYTVGRSDTLMSIVAKFSYLGVTVNSIVDLNGSTRFSLGQRIRIV